MLDDVFTWDNVLHVLGGAAIAALLLPAYWRPETLPLCAWAAWSIWGLLREQAQSRDKKDFFVPFKEWHKFCEGMAWGVGALVGTAVPILIWG